MQKCAIGLAMAAALSVITVSAQVKKPETAGNSQTAKLAPLFGSNLLKNGGIEATTTDEKKVPGWMAADGFTRAEYGSVGGEWDWGLSGCQGCGKYYARLAFDGDVHELLTSQTVDVSAGAAKIDANKVTVTISAYLGGYRDADTTSVLNASFQDVDGKELGSLVTDPVDTKALQQAAKGSTSLALCEKSGSLPAGTKKIVFTWHAKSTGDSADYLALGDNFLLQLTASD